MPVFCDGTTTPVGACRSDDVCTVPPRPGQCCGERCECGFSGKWRCSPDHFCPCADTGVLTTLDIVPSDVVCVVDISSIPGKPCTQVFRALRSDSGDVTASTTFEIDDPTLGTFAGATFTSIMPLPAGDGTLAGFRGFTCTRVRATDGTLNAVGRLRIVEAALSGPTRSPYFVSAYKADPVPSKETLVYTLDGTTTLDVGIGVTNDPANPSSIDATKLALVRAWSIGSKAMGCVAWPTKDTDGDGIHDTFVGVKPGTTCASTSCRR